MRPRIGLHLDIAGDGPEREALERQAARLGLTDRVTFHGWLLQDAWPARFSSSRLDGRGNEVAIETLELAYDGLELE